MTDSSLIDSLLRSNVRTSILIAIANDCTSTQSLLDSDLASESGVYNTLTRLREQGLIHSPQADHWSLTGLGQVAAKLIDNCQQTESVLAIDSEFWRTHDVTAIPPRFRLRLSELAGGQVITATETRPSNAISEIERRLENANAISAITPVYDEQLANAGTTGEIERLVFDEAVFNDVIQETISSQLEAKETIRVTNVSVTVTITDDCLLLSLPTLDGTYGPQTVFVAETEEAQYWGNDLLDFYWGTAQPLEQYVSGKN